MAELPRPPRPLWRLRWTTTNGTTGITSASEHWPAHGDTLAALATRPDVTGVEVQLKIAARAWCTVGRLGMPTEIELTHPPVPERSVSTAGSTIDHTRPDGYVTSTTVWRDAGGTYVSDADEESW